MGAARDEGDVGAGLGQRRAKSATDPAGADNPQYAWIRSSTWLAKSGRLAEQGKHIRPEQFGVSSRLPILAPFRP